MKFSPLKSLKSKSFFVYLTILLVSGFIFSKNLDLNNFVTSFFAPTATISVDTYEVCKDEPVTITFEGSNGKSPYIFTYILNSVQMKTTASSGNTFNLVVDTSIPGSYEFELIYMLNL